MIILTDLMFRMGEARSHFIFHPVEKCLYEHDACLVYAICYQFRFICTHCSRRAIHSGRVHSLFTKIFDDIADSILPSFCFERLLACFDDLF